MSVDVYDGVICVFGEEGPPGPAGTPGSAITPPGAILATPYQLTDDDAGAVLTWSGSTGCIVMVPNGLAVGFNCRIVMLGSGPIAAVAIGSAEVTAPNNRAAVQTQFGALQLIPVAVDTYVLAGGDTVAGGGLDFSDPNNSGLLPGL